ncbi:hypothetical protein D1872_231470 [compost metagenome]
MLFRPLDKRLQERLADASPLVIAAHAHPERTGVGNPPFLSAQKIKETDNSPLVLRKDHQVIFVAAHPFDPVSFLLDRQSEFLGHRQQVGFRRNDGPVEFQDTFGVPPLRGPKIYVTVVFVDDFNRCDPTHITSSSPSVDLILIPIFGQHAVHHMIDKMIIEPFRLPDFALQHETEPFGNRPAAAVAFAGPNFHPVHIQ